MGRESAPGRVSSGVALAVAVTLLAACGDEPAASAPAAEAARSPPPSGGPPAPIRRPRAAAATPAGPDSAVEGEAPGDEPGGAGPPRGDADAAGPERTAKARIAADLALPDPLPDDAVDRLLAAWEHQDIATRTSFLRRLRTGRSDRFVALFRHDSAEIATWAIRGARFRADGWPEFPHLIEAFAEDARTEVRVAALGAACAPGAAAAAARTHVARIEPLLDDPDPEVARSAAAYLGLVGGVSDSGFESMVRLLRGGGLGRYETVRALQTLESGRRDVVEELARIVPAADPGSGPAAGGTDVPRVRAETARAVRALATNGPAAPDVARPVLERLAASPDTATAVSALRGLAILDGARERGRAASALPAVARLRAIADDSASAGRDPALRVLGEFAFPDDAGRFLAALDAPDDFHRGAGAEGLLRLAPEIRAAGGSPAPWERAVEALARTRHEQVRANLAEAVVALLPPGDHAAAARCRTRLAEILRDLPSEEVAWAARDLLALR